MKLSSYIIIYFKTYAEERRLTTWLLKTLIIFCFVKLFAVITISHLSRQVRQCLANLNFFPMPFILTSVLCRKVCTSKERIKVHLIPSTKWKIQMFDLQKHNCLCYRQARPWPQCNYSIMRKHTLKNKQINNGKFMINTIMYQSIKCDLLIIHSIYYLFIQFTPHFYQESHLR